MFILEELGNTDEPKEVFKLLTMLPHKIIPLTF